jgi:hypothetical protein
MSVKLNKVRVVQIGQIGHLRQKKKGLPKQTLMFIGLGKAA